MAGIYSIRADAETDAALESLGATSGNRSKIIKEAILHLAEHRLQDRVRVNPRRLIDEIEAAVMRVAAGEPQ